MSQNPMNNQPPPRPQLVDNVATSQPPMVKPQLPPPQPQNPPNPQNYQIRPQQQPPQYVGQQQQRFPSQDYPPPIRRLDSRSSVFGPQGQQLPPPGQPPGPQFRPPSGPIRYPPPPQNQQQQRPINPNNQQAPVRFLQRAPSIDASGHLFRPVGPEGPRVLGPEGPRVLGPEGPRVLGPEGPRVLGPEGYQQQQQDFRARPNPLLQAGPRFSIDNNPQQLLRNDSLTRKMSIGAVQQQEAAAAAPRMRQKPEFDDDDDVVTDRPSSGWRQEQKPSSTGEVVNISSSLLSGQTREIRPEQNPPPRTPIKAQQSQDNMMIKSPQVTMAPKPMTPAVNEQPPRAQEVLTSASESPSVKTAAGGEMVAQVEVCKPPSVQLVDKQDSGKVQGFDNGQVRPLSAAGGDQAKVQEDKPMQLDLETVTDVPKQTVTTNGAARPTANGELKSPTAKKAPPRAFDSQKSSAAGSPVKSPSKTIKSLPKTPDTPTSGTSSQEKKLPMNKVQVGAAASPNLKVVRSKIGSLENASYKPGGGKVKIENRKLDFSKAQPKIAAKNDKYAPSGGDKKIQHQKLQWNVKSKIGSLDNATYRPGGGDKKIESVKLDFKDKAKPKVGSKDNAKHMPGGGNVKSASPVGKVAPEPTPEIEMQKLDIKAESKVGSFENVKHKPGGGDKKIFDDKDYLRQASSNVESLSGSGTQSPVPSGAMTNSNNGLPTSDENLNLGH